MKQLIAFLLLSCFIIYSCTEDDSLVDQANIELTSRSECVCPEIGVTKLTGAEGCCNWTITIINNSGCPFFLEGLPGDISTPTPGSDPVNPADTLTRILVTCCGDEDVVLKLFRYGANGKKIYCPSKRLSCCASPPSECKDCGISLEFDEPECLLEVIGQGDCGPFISQEWTFNGNPLPPQPDPNAAGISPRFPGTYCVTVVYANGCTSTECFTLNEECSLTESDCNQCSIEIPGERLEYKGQLYDSQLTLGATLRTCSDELIDICNDMTVVMRNETGCTTPELIAAWNETHNSNLTWVSEGEYQDCIENEIRSIAGCEDAEVLLIRSNNTYDYSVTFCENCPLKYLYVNEGAANMDTLCTQLSGLSYGEEWTGSRSGCQPCD